MRKVKLPKKRLVLALVIGIIIATLSLTLPLPRLKIIPTQAEVATQGDWIGLFAVEGIGTPAKNNKEDTYNGGSWVYTGNIGDPNGCRTGLGNIPDFPWLSGQCNPFSSTWTLPTGGAYEFRLYGNAKGLQTDGSADALVGQSLSFWGPMQVTANCRKSMTGIYVINVFWPSNLLVGKGVSSFELLKNSIALPFPGDNGGYSDSSVATGSAYIYSIKEYTVGGKNDKTGQNNHTFDAPSITVNDSNCTPAWLKTSGGDVHTNR
ncbi:MAG: hypothetical protein UU73_C0002G0003 [Candidatus Daviesbacteria bacterium GW2011_GWA1_41_61]|uniref:Uncharacterized protein n=1 Tax=Candidatus Daviesbacteria bacterium GW2011_GWA2_40_9 TaxID=1618424 RepID=A0A0G0TYR4_9BACT|nr:MAG: hypothetical protein UU26_C0008G0030 [Candidatus Daviesbacteria bacterium GW2011_GWC1_40_9]KKR82029.1 MAG: hypothetical protein UU29_C0019G0003 [Candidatus Daviesbacteria bacterium GW2011_GWA2_40_9]KKR93663.1 MAG: hypothetical protein UU44_C0001G0003 [Candidatus Daviesbacteria bacterium GW2011_GWB1_41_15]KKS15129.1 MAG: hypothetical protein UU73_C0002G0003 [Candidatus Daviesbacteria bacterium GW2011_GWA1_41_61]